MTQYKPTELDRLWDEIPAGSPPIDQLLREGRAAVRNKRRARSWLAGATVLVTGTAATFAWLASSGSDRIERPPVDNNQSVESALSDQEYAYAIDVARETLRQQQDVDLTSATVKAVSGTEINSNTGYRCESGRLLRIKLIGTFPHIVTGGPVQIPGLTAKDVDTTVHAVLLTADAQTGHACLIGVQIGDVEPLPGSTSLDLTQIGADAGR